MVLLMVLLRAIFVVVRRVLTPFQVVSFSQSWMFWWKGGHLGVVPTSSSGCSDVIFELKETYFRGYRRYADDEQMTFGQGQSACLKTLRLSP